jgi:hypothetical protein
MVYAGAAIAVGAPAAEAISEDARVGPSAPLPAPIYKAGMLRRAAPVRPGRDRTNLPAVDRADSAGSRTPCPASAFSSMMQLGTPSTSAKDRTQDFQELADEAFADLLRKHGRPTDLKTALRESVAGMERPPHPGGRRVGQAQQGYHRGCGHFAPARTDYGGGGHGEQVAGGARKRWDEWRRADGVRLTYLNWSRGA